MQVWHPSMERQFTVTTSKVLFSPSMHSISIDFEPLSCQTWVTGFPGALSQGSHFPVALGGRQAKGEMFYIKS